MLVRGIFLFRHETTFTNCPGSGDFGKISSRHRFPINHGHKINSDNVTCVGRLGVADCQALLQYYVCRQGRVDPSCAMDEHDKTVELPVSRRDNIIGALLRERLFHFPEFRNISDPLDPFWIPLDPFRLGIVDMCPRGFSHEPLVLNQWTFNGGIVQLRYLFTISFYNQLVTGKPFQAVSLFRQIKGMNVHAGYFKG